MVIFAIGSMVSYTVLKSIINKEFNEKLFAEQEQLIFELNTYANLEKNYYLNIGDVIDLEQIDYNPQIKPMLRDTVMYDPFEKKELPFRQLIFSDKIKEHYYVITISKSLLPNQDLIEGITEIMIILVLTLMFSLGLLNRVIFTKLWAPFHQIIKQLHLFKITNPEPIDAGQSNVDEFNELSDVLDKMITKSIHDYKMLKEYTENTSHEIQTPLAIIKNKAEILLQEPLAEKQLIEVSKIYEAAGRLARLKEGLSMLTKIENNQFIDSELIELKPYIEARVSGFDELIEMKGLKVSLDLQDNPAININGDLAYMMTTNLLSNAIKHNIPNGTIYILLTSKHLLIENTGKKPEIPTSELFDRFKKSGNTQESTGLGLSLIKRITEQYGMDIEYVFDSGIHSITITFESNKKPLTSA